MQSERGELPQLAASRGTVRRDNVTFRYVIVSLTFDNVSAPGLDYSKLRNRNASKSGLIAKSGNGADSPDMESRNALKSEHITAHRSVHTLLYQLVGTFTLAICRNKCYSVDGANAPGALHNGRRLATPPERG